MKITDKIKLLKQYYPDCNLKPITTQKFNGIWWLINDFEHVVLSNEEAYYASNNIVVGNMSDNFKHTEEFPELMVYSHE